MSDTSRSSLSFLCFGAGAIGTYIGGSLILSGHPVVFLDRPELAPGLREHGLCIERGGTKYAIPAPRIATSLEEALTYGPFDAAILAVKSFDTQALVESILPYKVALPPIICFQNGVENEPLLVKELGEDKVIPATVTTAIGRGQAGSIVVERLRGIGLHADHVLSANLEGVMAVAQLNPRLYENAPAMKWSKMLTNLLANASSAILNLSPAEIFAHPGLFRMEMEMLREALRVMKAMALPVIDLPGTPVRMLAFAGGSLPPSLSQPLLRPSLGKGRGAKMPSFHIDLYAGRGRSEVDYLNGAVVRAGKRLGVPTPVNQLLNQTLLALTLGEIPIERYAGKPEEFLDLLKGGKNSFI